MGHLTTAIFSTETSKARKFLLILALFPYWGIAQSLQVNGTVFYDINNNGIRDAGESGIAGVVVSDQVNVVSTDDHGRYQINELKGNGLIMISVPNGYRARDSFWKKAAQTDLNAIDFPLLKIKQPSSFSFIHASDTHVSEASLQRMEKLSAAIAQANPDFVLVTGDLVRDALRVPEPEAAGYYELFLKEIAKIKTQVWCVPGNHEIFGIERHLSLVSKEHPLYGRKMYRHYLGPDYYSFNYAGVHFIALNSLAFDDLWYYGHVDSVQLEWLKKDVAVLSTSTPIVTFQHVPFYGGGLSLSPFETDGPGRTTEKVNGVQQFRHVVSNAKDVLTILKGHNFPLALAGHYHFQQKFTLQGVQTRFEQAAAVIGPAQGGVFQMPSGITLYRVKNGAIDEGTFIPLDQP